MYECTDLGAVGARTSAEGAANLEQRHHLRVRLIALLLPLQAIGCGSGGEVSRWPSGGDDYHLPSSTHLGDSRQATTEADAIQSQSFDDPLHTQNH